MVQTGCNQPECVIETNKKEKNVVGRPSKIEHTEGANDAGIDIDEMHDFTI